MDIQRVTNIYNKKIMNTRYSQSWILYLCYTIYFDLSLIYIYVYTQDYNVEFYSILPAAGSL